MIRPWWRIAIRSASCSASSRYWVVSSTVVPPSASSFTVCHTSMRACGSRPVVGSSRKITGGSPIRLIAMSSRRRMPPEYVAGLPAAGLGEREAREQVVGDPAGVLQVPQLSDQHEVLAAGEDLVDRGELPGEADRLAHVLRPARRRRSRATVGGAGIRLQQRRQDLARPSSCPRRSSRAGRRCCRGATSKSTPRSTCTSLNDFSSPATWIAAAGAHCSSSVPSPRSSRSGGRAPCRSSACPSRRRRTPRRTRPGRRRRSRRPASRRRRRAPTGRRSRSAS